MPLLHSAALSVLLLSLSIGAVAAPRVVASITPVHSLVSGVMAGAGEPRLLVRGYASPHAYQMRPSDARALEKADLVFWIGPTLERFLEKPLRVLAQRANVVALLDTEQVNLLPLRRGGAWGRDEAPGHRHGTGETEDHDMDPHIWLSPANARAMVRTMVQALDRVDPTHGEAYRRNGRALRKRIARMDSELGAALAPVRNEPYLVLHDAYQYLEQHYALSALGSLTLGPETRPGAKRVRELQAVLKSSNARCVFGEPQLSRRMLDLIVAEGGVRRGTLDPLGATRTPSSDAYFDMMAANVKALAGCLGDGPLTLTRPLR